MADDDFKAFAGIEDLKNRWSDFPVGAESLAQVLLEDASQYILDTHPRALRANPRTLRRIVCSVVRRSMESDETDLVGLESIQQGAGAYQETRKAINPHGDFYLTGQEEKALNGPRKAFSLDLTGGDRRGIENT